MFNWINKKRSKKGFTLIELIVVVAILGILAALAVPRLTGSRDRANRSAVLANLRTIESALTIAEAEGADLTVEDVDDLLEVLKTKDYLNAVPSGPKGVTEYSIDDNNRATVKFDEDKQFGFLVPQGTGTIDVSASTVYTLDKLVEPAN